MLTLATRDAKRFLFIGAHSDDIEIGCGGSVLSLLAGRSDVQVLWVVFSAGGDRTREAVKSARALLPRSSPADVRVLDFRTSYFPSQVVEIKDCFETLKTFAPDIVFTHTLGDRHQDHRVLAELTWNTFRNHLVLEYEIPKYEGDLGHPNAYVPLSAAVVRRKARHLCRHFQTQGNKHWFSEDTFLALARLRGIECAAPSGFAEAFHMRKLLLGHSAIRGLVPADACPLSNCMSVRSDRLASIDTFRGLVMLLLLAEALRTCSVAQALPDSRLWAVLCLHQTHVEWAGWHLHDLIQPAFVFLVGVSMACSIAGCSSRGESRRQMLWQAARRSIALVFLGILVLSVHPRHILWKFEDTLTSIGLGYWFVFALVVLRPRLWGMALVLLLIGEWVGFAAFPVPSAGFDYEAVGVTEEWLQRHGLSGWAAHWQKNANVAYAFDTWFLQLFPGNEHYVAPKGLTTLNFVPMMGTMILGWVAGREMLAQRRSAVRLARLAGLGSACLCAVALFAGLGWCPLVKSLWTPSWVLFSGGLCLLTMAGLHATIDLLGGHRFVLPVVVVGRNSLAAYLLHHLYRAFAWGSIQKVLGVQVFLIAGAAYQPFLYGLAVMALLWSVLYAMHRANWYLRV